MTPSVPTEKLERDKGRDSPGAACPGAAALLWSCHEGLMFLFLIVWLEKNGIFLLAGTSTSVADVGRRVSNRRLGWKEDNIREGSRGRFLSQLFVLLGFGLGY